MLKIPAAIWLLVLCLASSASQVEDLRQGFATPPPSARPWVYWFWVDGNVTRAGITADLEAMQRVGIGGVIMFDVAQDIPAGDVQFGSPTWRALFKHTVTEAERLGLQVSVHNAAGWTGSGGPWVTPDLAMQKVVFSVTNLLGPAQFKGKLPRLPDPTNQPIGTLAFPTLLGDSKPLSNSAPKIASTRYRIELHQAKAGLGPLPTTVPSPGPSPPPEALIAPDRILDLSSQTKPDGSLTWEVPAGQWTVLRLASAPVGRLNNPARPGGAGLECDKLSQAAIEKHFESFVGQLATDVADATGRTFTGVHVDSWEIGFQNWTPGFEIAFSERRGYAPIRFLPALTGRFIGSPEISERFLWDMRRTIADLLADNYAGHLAELAHRHKLQLSVQAYCSQGKGPFDDLQYASRADMPMCEFWKESDWPSGVELKAMPSAAHVWGKPIVPAEAFTSYPTGSGWKEHPFALKPLGDAAFCQGVNRLAFHRFAHQPWLNRWPGMTMGQWGVHYERTQTWWQQSTAWHQYLARCQFLLQRGSFVADVCYLTTEGAFTQPPNRDKLLPPLPAGYDYDLAAPEAVLGRMSTEEGRIVLPDGMSYGTLVLPPRDLMTPGLLRKLKQLVVSGATVVGPRPSHSPSLQDYPRCDTEVKQLADELWGSCDGKSVFSHPFGKGTIAWGKPLAELLQEKGFGPDFQELTRPVGFPLRWIHRRINGMELYFVANPNPRSLVAQCQFRVTGKAPEFWLPDTGQILQPAAWRPVTGGTSVTIPLDAGGSLFVVFERSSSGLDPAIAIVRNGQEEPSANVTFDASGKMHLLASKPGSYRVTTVGGKTLTSEVKTLAAPIVLGGNWEVSFPGGVSNRQVMIEKLRSWTEFSDPDIKYFSGTALYTHSLDLAPTYLRPQATLVLELGDVRVMARLKVNSHDLGILWKPPFSADVTGALEAGRNEIKIEVVNLWPNRLIGDEQLEEDCRWRPMTNPDMGTPLLEWPKWLLEDKPRPTGRQCFSTWKLWRKDSPLLPSGLLGPVRIKFAQEIELK